MDEPEFHLAEVAKQAEHYGNVGSSPRAATEDLWRQGKTTPEEQRSVASPAQIGGAARPGRQAASQKPPASHTTQSRHYTRSQKKKVSFNLERNMYASVDYIDRRWGPVSRRRM